MADIELNVDDFTDIMPNDGSVFQPEMPDTRREEVNAEKAATLTSAPILDDLFAWFDRAIALADSIDGLDVESNVPVESQIMARQILKTMLQAERSRLETLKNTYIR